MKTYAIILFFSTLLENSMHQSKFEPEIKISVMKSRIVNGVPTLITSHPYVVGIGAKGNVGCAGSIIDDRVVLTAAHCISPRMNIIYAGSDKPGKGMKYKACRSVLHPNYTLGSFEYDIGLIFTERPFRFNNRIQKVTIAPHPGWKKDKTKLVVAGFGVISTNDYIETTNLYSTRLNVLDSKTCNKLKTTLKFGVTFPKHEICLVGDHLMNNCAGDAGSGVIWGKYIVGVVSAGRDLYCGLSLSRVMYTNVWYFKSWIRAEIKNHNPRSCRSKKLDKLKNMGYRFL